MIKPEKEKLGYPVRSGLTGKESAFHKTQFKIKEMLELVPQQEKVARFVKYHGLEKFLERTGLYFEYPSALRVDIRISKKGVPRLFYQYRTDPRSVAAKIFFDGGMEG